MSILPQPWTSFYFEDEPPCGCPLPSHNMNHKLKPGINHLDSDNRPLLYPKMIPKNIPNKPQSKHSNRIQNSKKYGSLYGHPRGVSTSPARHTTDPPRRQHHPRGAQEHPRGKPCCLGVFPYRSESLLYHRWYVLYLVMHVFLLLGVSSRVLF